MMSDDYNETVDSCDISVRLSDSLYGEGGIPDYLFLQEDEDGYENSIKADSVQAYNQVQNSGFYCDNKAEFGDLKDQKVNSKRKSSVSSSNSELRGVVKGKQEVTTEDMIPEEMTYSAGSEFGIKYRYIADFCVYNNKLSRMIPLDSLPNNYESIYFNGEKSTLDSFVTYKDGERGSVSENTGRDVSHFEEFTMTGVLIPCGYIFGFEKERNSVLRDNYRKLLRARQKGSTSGFKSKKTKEISRSFLRHEGLNTFSVACRIYSWTIEFGNSLYDPPNIWVNSIPEKGGPKVCYRLIWPASKYSKYYSSTKLKFDIVSRLVKTLLSPNSNRIGYKTFLDQVTGNTQDKSGKKQAALTETGTSVPNGETEDNSDHVSAGSTVSGETPSVGVSAKKNSKDSGVDGNNCTVWGDSVSVTGSTEKDVLLMYGFIEDCLKAYSERHSLSKTLGLQILTTMKNKLIKMILSEDSSLNESDVASNLTNYLQNVELMERIFSQNKIQTGNKSSSVHGRADGNVGTSGNTGSKRRRSSVSKAEDALKNYLPKVKCYADSFEACLDALRKSFFFGVYGDYLDLPPGSSSLLSIQSYYSKICPESRSAIEMIKCFYSEYKMLVGRQSRTSLDGNERKILQDNLVEFMKIVNVFPKSLFFSVSSRITSFISEKLLKSRSGFVADESGQEGSKKQTKKCSLVFKTEEQQEQAGNYPLSVLDDTFLEEILSKNYVDEVTWPIILDEIQRRLDSTGSSENRRYKDDGNGGNLGEEDLEGTGTIRERNVGCFKKGVESMFRGDSFLGVLNWLTETLLGDKLGKAFLEQINTMQNATVSGASQKKKSGVFLGRNDNLLGTDRYLNKYYLFNNTKTSNTLNKSLVIVPSCSESINNEYLSHKPSCNNPICTDAIYKNKMRAASDSLTWESGTTSCYRYITKKKDLDTIMTCLNEEHYCEFQLKLKLRGLFCNKELEHEPFDPERYVRDGIKENKQIIVPFGFNALGMDMERQYICFSLLSLFREISVLYMKVTFPILVCLRDDTETHFRVMDELFRLSLVMFECFLGGSGATPNPLFGKIIGDVISLFKFISKSTIDCLVSVGVSLNRTQEKNYELWVRYFEKCGNTDDNGATGSSGLYYGTSISALSLYLKIWTSKILPREISSISFGGSKNSLLDPFSNFGYVYDREQFLSFLRNGNMNDKYAQYLPDFVPEQQETMYYFRSGHLLVILDWINSIISERRGGEEYVKFIEHFHQVPQDVSVIERIQVCSICYNTGSRRSTGLSSADSSGGEEGEVGLCPFILLNCKLFPRKNEEVPDEIESHLKILKENIEAIESSGRDLVSRKRTSNRIKNNNLSNSFREAAIADSSYTIVESRESFIKRNIRNISKARTDADRECMNIHLILPIYVSNGRKSGSLLGPFGRSLVTNSSVQKKSLEIDSFRPTTSHYLVKDTVFKNSVDRFASRDGSRISYFVGDKVHHGVITRLVSDGNDVWDCIMAENDDLKKNKERSLVCLNLWQVISD